MRIVEKYEYLDLHQKIYQHKMSTSLILLPLPATGLVEGGGERSPGFCSCCLCEETRPHPVLFQGKPAG